MRKKQQKATAPRRVAPATKQETPDQARFLGIRKVLEIADASKSTIRRRIDAGEFPQPVIVEGNFVRWSYLEVKRWADEQYRKRDERLAKARAAESTSSAAAA